jgi:hypothetical protein
MTAMVGHNGGLSVLGGSGVMRDVESTCRKWRVV